MGYETKVLNKLDRNNIDAEFRNGVLYLFDHVDVMRAEDVLITWVESDEPDRIHTVPEMCTLDESEL